MRLSKLQNIFPYIIVALSLILYSYYMIIDIITEGEAGVVTRQAVCLLVMEAFSVYALVVHSKINPPTLYKAFFLWIIWLLIDFFVFGLGGAGISNYILATSCAFAFFYYFYLSIDNKTNEKVIVLSFLVLLVVSGIMCVQDMLSFRELYRGEDAFVSNLVFWPLCTMPFIFLIEKRIPKWIFLFVITVLVVITAKRSATISLIITIFFYVLFLIKDSGKTRSKSKFRMILLIGVLGVASYFIIDKFLSSEVVIVSNRLSTMQEDQGSGRMGIYSGVINSINNFDLADYLVGKGYRSILSTGHTNAHNDALQVFYEYGIVGLIFYLVITVAAIKRLFYVRKRYPKYYPGYMASISIYVVLGLVSNLYAYNTYFMFICAYWGLVEGEIYRTKRLGVKNYA